MADTAPVHSNPSAPIPLTYARINGVEQACIQARLLHQYLQNPIGFLDWFRIKTETLGLVCHRHYKPLVQALAGEAAPQQNFLLTLPAATVLTAAENSDRGQQLCRYLIAAVSQQDVPLPSQPSLASSISPCITSAQTQRLQKLARERMRHTGLPYQTVWTELKHRFGIHSYHNLPSDQFEAACQFLCRPPTVKNGYRYGGQPVAAPNRHANWRNRSGRVPAPLTGLCLARLRFQARFEARLAYICRGL